MAQMNLRIRGLGFRVSGAQSSHTEGMKLHALFSGCFKLCSIAIDSRTIESLHCKEGFRWGAKT